MTSTASDQPRWASPPQESILSLLHEKGLSVEDLSDRLPLSDTETRRFIEGQVPMTLEIAEALHLLIGGSARFWMTRASHYVESVNWIDADHLAHGMPLRDAARFGWIDESGDWVETAQRVLEYFGVRDATEWRRRYQSSLAGAQYRVSKAFEANELAVITWMRQVERTADTLGLDEWNPSSFRGALQAARKLTRIKNPETFYPRLQSLFRSVGVAVVIERPPTGCSINGATFETRGGSKVIGLTARHRSDDVFWFTFFHEAGHVLEDDLTEPIIDDLEDETLTKAEIAADRFAEAELLQGYELSPKDGRSHTDVIRLAARLGIAPGIIVGQLQHRDLLSHKSLNALKRSYDWSGTSLVQR